MSLRVSSLMSLPTSCPLARELVVKLAARLTAVHGRATTRAVHPVVSRTINRTAIADRLRIGFDKRRPPPLALVAALA